MVIIAVLLLLGFFVWAITSTATPAPRPRTPVLGDDDWEIPSLVGDLVESANDHEPTHDHSFDHDHDFHVEADDSGSSGGFDWFGDDD